jgi:pyruvate/2-oxoglutarate dehydrogenase complex dihydrolipoamide dehydrogenase (E3) component
MTNGRAGTGNNYVELERCGGVILAETPKYDVAVIGSGPGGYVGAIRAGQLGLKTVLVEKDNKFGGTCLHVGCIPTKDLLLNAEVYDYFKRAKEFGIDCKDFTLDWAAVMARKAKVVTKLAKGVEFLLKKNKVAWPARAASVSRTPRTSPGRSRPRTLFWRRARKPK